MEQEKIDRINDLAKKSTTETLTSEEHDEQKLLREEYIAAFKLSLTGQLDNIYIIDEDGNKHKLKKRG